MILMIMIIMILMSAISPSSDAVYYRKSIWNLQSVCACCDFLWETLQGQIWWGSAKIISVDEQGTCTPLIRLFSLLICFDLFLEMGQKKNYFYCLRKKKAEHAEKWRENNCSLRQSVLSFCSTKSSHRGLLFKLFAY